MFANRKYKFLMIGLLSVLVFAKTRSLSISQIGDVRIEVSNDKWLCDKLECPPETHRCYVAKHKDPSDATIMVRTNICYSKQNEALLKSVTNEIIDPNTSIKMQLNSYRSGVISSYNSYSSNDGGNFDEKKFNEDLNNDLKNMKDDMVREMTNMKRNLKNEMTNLKSNLRQMSHNLNHMFDD